MPVVNANSVDPDQTLRSDLGLHCLPMSHLWDARPKLVNSFTAIGDYNKFLQTA